MGDKSRSEGSCGKQKPRVGVPYRSAAEEAAGEAQRAKIRPYLEAVEAAGGEAVLVSLSAAPAELYRLAKTLDAIVLPGSGVDVAPARYGARRHAKCADADPNRERVDYALLDAAFEEQKPVLAICYGVQLLNVYRGGTLVQDIPSELDTAIQHPWTDRVRQPEPHHPVRIEPNGRLAGLAGTAEATVNSSHHQAIREPGKGLRVVAKAPDGVIEAVEWSGDANWVLGVQWHPERMMGDALAQALFRELLEAARASHDRTTALRGG